MEPHLDLYALEQLAGQCFFCLTCIFGLIGALRVHSGWSHADPDWPQQALAWFGSTLFLGWATIALYVFTPQTTAKRSSVASIAHTTYDQLSVTARADVLKELAWQATRLCDCQLDRKGAHDYMVRVAVPVENGRLDVEYSKWIVQKYVLRPVIQVRSRVVTDTLRTYDYLVDSTLQDKPFLRK